jgi:uncharacterized protein (DUF433 family)
MHNHRIEIDPRVCAGKPVIRGTRMPVAVLVAELAEGRSWGDIIRGHPELSEEDIRAALEYASEAVEHTEFMDAVAG